MSKHVLIVQEAASFKYDAFSFYSVEMYVSHISV